MKLSNGWLNRMKMNKMPSKFSEKKMKEVTIIGILRGFSKEKILSVISIYAEAGFSTIEITMNTQGACQEARGKHQENIRKTQRRHKE